jgi:hypothetical protein
MPSRLFICSIGMPWVILFGEHVTNFQKLKGWNNVYHIVQDQNLELAYARSQFLPAQNMEKAAKINHLRC